MTKKKDNNVINLFSATQSMDNLPKEIKEQVKFYAGFNYIKHKKDLNGNSFSKENLLNYASKCNYTVTVMREINSEIFLYSYHVPNSDLFKFMKSFEENKLDGTIIKIDRYFPEDLA